MTIIWFNLLLLMNGQVSLINTFETLEECQAYRQELEITNLGDYYCRWVRVEKT